MLPQWRFAEIEIHDVGTIPSYEMSVQFAFDLAKRIKDVLGGPEVAGVVVTHGTDTMEETCYLADLLLDSDKPAVYTGAQRAHDDPQSDGPLNLLNALRVAAAPSARGLGAMICFNGTIHAARDGPRFMRARWRLSIIRTLCFGRGRWRRSHLHRGRYCANGKGHRTEERVELFSAQPLESTCRGLRRRSRGPSGLVIEGFGAARSVAVGRTRAAGQRGRMFPF